MPRKWTFYWLLSHEVHHACEVRTYVRITSLEKYHHIISAKQTQKTYHFLKLNCASLFSNKRGKCLAINTFTWFVSKKGKLVIDWKFLNVWSRKGYATGFLAPLQSAWITRPRRTVGISCSKLVKTDKPNIQIIVVRVGPLHHASLKSKLCSTRYECYESWGIYYFLKLVYANFIPHCLKVCRLIKRLTQFFSQFFVKIASTC